MTSDGVPGMSLLKQTCKNSSGIALNTFLTPVSAYGDVRNY